MRYAFDDGLITVDGVPVARMLDAAEFPCRDEETEDDKHDADTETMIAGMVKDANVSASPVPGATKPLTCWWCLAADLCAGRPCGRGHEKGAAPKHLTPEQRADWDRRCAARTA